MATAKLRKDGKPRKLDHFSWDDSMYLKAFKLAQSGLCQKEIATALGYKDATGWKLLKARRPALAQAIAEGRSSTGRTEHDYDYSKNSAGDFVGKTFKDFVADVMPEHLQPIWDQLTTLDSEQNKEKQIETLLADKGKRIRQYLFIHSLVDCHFVLSKALARVNVPLTTYQLWLENDPDFPEVLDVIKQAKEDFIRTAVMDLVAVRDGPTVKAAAQAMLPEFAPKKIRVALDGDVQHLHAAMDVNKLLEDIPLDQRLKMLEKMRGGQPATVKQLEQAVAEIVVENQAVEDQAVEDQDE